MCMPTIDVLLTRTMALYSIVGSMVNNMTRTVRNTYIQIKPFIEERKAMAAQHGKHWEGKPVSSNFLESKFMIVLTTSLAT